MNFAHAAMTDRDFAMELPKFATEVRAMFATDELRDYLDSVNRIGAFGHICSDDAHEFLRTSYLADEL